MRHSVDGLKFARYLWNTTEGDGDVCLLSWKSCRSQFERFTDSGSQPLFSTGEVLGFSSLDHHAPCISHAVQKLISNVSHDITALGYDDKKSRESLIYL